MLYRHAKPCDMICNRRAKAHSTYIIIKNIESFNERYHSTMKRRITLLLLGRNLVSYRVLDDILSVSLKHFHSHSLLTPSLSFLSFGNILVTPATRFEWCVLASKTRLLRIFHVTQAHKNDAPLKCRYVQRIRLGLDSWMVLCIMLPYQI